MKRTIILLSLTLIGFNSFSQAAKDTTIKLPAKLPIVKPAVADSTPTYYFKIADINAVLPIIEKQIYLTGWNNLTSKDVFVFFINYLEQKKQYK